MDESNIKQEPEEASVPVPEDFVFVKLTVKEEIIDTSGSVDEEGSTSNIYQPTEEQSDTYKCTNCSERFMNILTFKEHLDANTRQLEGGEVVLVCSDSSELKFNPGKAICQLCHATFKNTHFLNKHKSFHSDERQFMCTHCLKTFKTVSGLKSHLAWRHELKETFKCKECMFKCLYPVVLEHHVLRCHTKKSNGTSNGCSNVMSRKK